MPAIVEVKYFNTFILRKSVATGGSNIMWNGSRGIPFAKGGYSRGAVNDSNQWVIEESRIRGGYNNTSVDYGVKAYLVEEEPNSSNRINTLIYSGIFNSRTGVNNTNVFSVAEDITKSLDPANGSIQKLYSEDTNLNIFQELKVSRALIDKDAIYSAEGGGTPVSSFTTVIGQIVPYLGKYGISQNPESFAIYGYNKYFADMNNNAILRLSRSGIDEISSIGMRDYFRDTINKINSLGTTGDIFGGWDIYSKQYTIKMQESRFSKFNQGYFQTLAFDDSIKGWTSFFSYNPSQIFSVRNEFFTTTGGQLYRHYSTIPNTRNNFYGVSYKSSITFVFNNDPTTSKTFKTIEYEGSNGWQVDTIDSDETGEDILNATPYTLYGNTIDTTNPSASPVASANIVLPTTASSTVVISSISGTIHVNDTITGLSVTANAAVQGFDSNTNTLTFNEPQTLSANTVLDFFKPINTPSVYSYQEGAYDLQGNIYPNTIGSTLYRAGFNRKENSYVANLINNSLQAPGEIIYGRDISGIKAFFATVKMSTDSSTNLGGEKKIFSASSETIYNNGY